MTEIRLLRVPEAVGREMPAPTFLVDRLWPRGVRKDDLQLDGWLKELAPSTELRRWFGHDPERWPEFRRRYLRELAGNRAAAEPLLDAARAHDSVVLVYGARDEQHNQAVVIREWLRRHRL